jgi:N-acyl-D-aspartate/D-glutamate deacylase
VLLPHVPLRVYTMGDRCDAAPTQADLDAMRRLVGEAMAVKAAGLAQKLGKL